MVFTAGLARGSHRVCDLEEWAQRLLGSAIAVERPVIVGGLVGKLLEHAPALVAQQVKQRRSGQNAPIGNGPGNAGSEPAVTVYAGAGESFASPPSVALLVDVFIVSWKPYG